MVVALAVVTGCGSSHPPPTPHPPPDSAARAFALRAIDVLERDDLDGWRDLLSTRLRLRTDEPALRRMFDAWRQFLVPHASALRDADWTVARNDVISYRTIGRAPEPLARVVDENGTLRIDDN